MSLLAELEANFNKFTIRFEAELIAVRASLASERKLFLDSFTRVASLNAWREHVLNHHISDASLAFFLEAQNDALTSHVFARFGAWRSANQVMRSCIENTLMCLYFKDHPIELKLWHAGKFRIGFTALRSYLETHPDLSAHTAVNGLELIAQEYATLCKAVHGAATFRMTTTGGGTRLWSDEKPSAGKWATSERQTIRAINLLLLTMFREHLQGAKLPGVRAIVGHVMSKAQHGQVKQHLSIML